MFLEEVTAAMTAVQQLAAEFDGVDAQAAADREAARVAIAQANRSRNDRSLARSKLLDALTLLTSIVEGVGASLPPIPDPDLTPPPSEAAALTIGSRVRRAA